MALNPMQRKARTSFLLGMFFTLIITGVIIAFLIMKLGQAKKKEESIVTDYVYTAATSIVSGEKIDRTSTQLTLVDVTMIPSNAITDANISKILVEGATSKIALEKGTILTTNMIGHDAETETSDVRLQEYNMIVLPSMLKEKDYVDIRLRLPSGEDYIVLSKKYVEKATADSIWIKVREDEILTMSNVIVEAYTMNGSLLYATQYTDAGMQNSLSPTYVVSSAVVSLINRNPNILSTAREKLAQRIQGDLSAQRTVIDEAMNYYRDQQITSVEERMSEDVEKQQNARQEYISSLSPISLGQ